MHGSIVEFPEEIDGCFAQIATRGFELQVAGETVLDPNGILTFLLAKFALIRIEKDPGSHSVRL
jgi:hypothetical protein